MRTEFSPNTSSDTGIKYLPGFRYSNRTNVLHIATTKHFGGLELAAIRMAERISQSKPNFRIVFACRPNSPVEQACDERKIQSIPFHIRNSADFFAVARLVQIVRENEIHLLHVHSRRDFVTATLAKAWLNRDKFTPAPKLILHSHLIRALGDPASLSGYLFAPYVDKVLAVSNATMAHVLSSHRQLNFSQVEVVYNGIDSDQYVFNPKYRAVLRHSFGFSDVDIVLGVVGRLNAKGQDRAIKAISTISDPRIKLLIIGSEGKAGTEARLRKVAASLHISEQVVFAGMRDDMARLYSAMDLLVHLPIDEAFGLAIAEAMACGCPVVASNIGGCNELVQNKVNGIMVDPLNSAQVVDSIAQLVNSERLRKTYGEEGRTIVINRFSFDRQIEHIIRVYDELVGTAKIPTDVAYSVPITV